MKPLTMAPLTLALLISFMQPLQAQEQPQAAQAAADQNSEQETDQKHKPTELDLPEDPSIKVTVHPVMPSNLVDRVAERATITVTCPGAVSTEIFIVGVDAPYGGHPLGRPRLLGADTKPGDGLTVPWTNPESEQYVKIFAVVRRRGLEERRVRSHTVDIAMYGVRYKPHKPAESRPAPEHNGNPEH